MGFGFVGVYGSGLGRFRVLGVVRLMLFGFLSKESTPKLCFTGVSGLGLWAFWVRSWGLLGLGFKVWGFGLRVSGGGV